MKQILTTLTAVLLCSNAYANSFTSEARLLESRVENVRTMLDVNSARVDSLQDEIITIRNDLDAHIAATEARFVALETRLGAIALCAANGGAYAPTDPRTASQSGRCLTATQMNGAPEMLEALNVKIQQLWDYLATH